MIFNMHYARIQAPYSPTISFESNGNDLCFEILSVRAKPVTVDMGDGTVYTTSEIRNTISHSYGSPGTYIVTIDGDIAYFDAATATPWAEDYSITRILSPAPRPSVNMYDGVTISCNSCYELLSIPSGMFDSLAGASWVRSAKATFGGCKKLQAIPPGLFDSLEYVTDFESCFASCQSLTSIPSGLFDNTIRANNFKSCFSGCTALTGEAPRLWEMYPDATGTYCFSGCTGLSNYSEIPSNWK